METAESVFRAREVRRIEHQDRWYKEATNNVIGVSRRIADGIWTVDRPVTHIDPVPPLPVSFEGDVFCVCGVCVSSCCCLRVVCVCVLLLCVVVCVCVVCVRGNCVTA